MEIGYGRVSTRERNPDAQHDALEAAGCDQLFVDRASGKLARRPGLDKAMDGCPRGDQLVVTKLDRLGRSLEHSDDGRILVTVDSGSRLVGSVVDPAALDQADPVLLADAILRASQAASDQLDAA